MKRRSALSSLVLLAGAAPGGAIATTTAPAAASPPAAGQPRRIAVLATGTAAGPSSQSIIRALEVGLARQGFLRGRDIEFELRGADNDVARLPALARELVALKPALIVASGNQMLPVVAAADPHVVVAGVGNLVGAGLAQSLNRPGGRATGVSTYGPALNPKRLELLTEALPAGAAIVLLGEPWAREKIAPELTAHAKRLGFRATLHEVRAVPDVEAAFVAAKRAGPAGVCVLESPLLSQLTAQVVAAARAHRVPTMHQWPDHVQEGALMGYGPRRSQAYEQLAVIIARILRGTPPGEIPIENVDRVVLAVNLGTAQAIGLRLPPALLARADEVIGS